MSVSVGVSDIAWMKISPQDIMANLSKAERKVARNKMIHEIHRR